MIKLAMDQIKYDDFAKVEFLIGEIKEAIEIEGSEKLLRLQVDFGEENLRTVFSGIKKWYSPADLIGKKTVFVANIIPRKIMGEESQAMIFAASAEAPSSQGVPEEETVSLLIPDKDLPVGSKVF
jgi:methionyl-tRNA synthetase